MLGTTDILKDVENLKRNQDANTLLILELFARVKKIEDKNAD